jgi:hypothetical protein
MVVGEVGRVRTFRISLWALALLGGFLVLFVFTSVMIINQYLDSLPLFRSQEDRIHQLEGDILGLQKELKRSKQYATVLARVITEQKAARQKSVSPPTPESEIPDQQSTAHVSEVSEKSREGVQVEDFAIAKDGAKLTVEFKLARVSEDEIPVSGHVYIIAMNGSTDPPQYWTYPKVALRDGVPIHYERGEFFKIKHFKMIRGTYYMEAESDLPSSVRVLVYDTSGGLILEQDFEVPSDEIQKSIH